MSDQASPARQPDCPHLGEIRDVTPQSAGCAECVALGDTWVHLRMCMICGHIGCCDDSKNKHATGHFHGTGHPIIRSFEPGEDWLWCYVDRKLMYPAGEDGKIAQLTVTREFLRGLPIFGELPDEQLSKLCTIAEPVTIPRGELLMAEGSAADEFFIIIDGEFEVIRLAGKQEVLLARRGAGEMLGEMSLIEQTPRMASVRALRDSRVLRISREAFYGLLAGDPAAVLGILRTFAMRLRSTEQLVVQSEKMASLGTLAAGLAHELNNPAAAALRSADQLRETLSKWQRIAGDLERIDLDEAQAGKLAELRDEMEARATRPAMLDPLDRSDREGELENWLDERGVDDAWDLAPALVSYSWDPGSLADAFAPFGSEHLTVLARWLACGSSAYGLLDEVRNSAQRISEIVKSVKTYSYLDEAPVQDVDVHEGLDSTLTMLRHNLKQGVAVHREYGAEVPIIEGYGSELNQVWTNLIDNAISAMHGKGELTIKTYPQGANVVVEIIDNGPGIPQELQTRIFEPFFTTKGPGVGTGLGLHIVYNIVVDKHHGQVKLTSRPGFTSFQVLLPVKLAR